MADVNGGVRFDKFAGNKLVFLAHVSAREGVPEIEVERTTSLGKPVEISLEELNEGGANGKGTEKVTLQLTGKPFATPTVPTFHIAITTTPGGGDSDLIVRARKDKNAKFEKVAELDIAVPVDKFNKPKAPIVKQLPLFPRLVVGINEALPDSDPQDTGAEQIATSSATLKPYLNRVLRILCERGTLDNAWVSQGEQPVEFDPTKALLQQAEQLWARQVAEMATLCFYGGANGTYGSNEFAVTVGHIQKGDDSKNNPLYSITFACQQLSSFIIASRGRDAFNPPKINMINAGSNTAPVFEQLGGRWIILPLASGPPKELPGGGGGDPLKMKNDDALKKAEKLFEIDEVFPDTPFGPGATFLFSNRAAKKNIGFVVGSKGCQITFDGEKDKAGNEKRTEMCIKPGESGGSEIESLWTVRKAVEGEEDILADNTAGAHVGSAIRINRVPPPTTNSDDPKNKRVRQLSRFQVLDTGGLRVPGWTDGLDVLGPVSDGKMHKGILEGPAAETVGSGDPLRGVGVLKKTESTDAEALATHALEVLRKARPLGFMRFALVKRSAKIQEGNVAKGLTDGRIMFVSALACLYAKESHLTDLELKKEDAPFANFSMTRLLWSLRGLPDPENVQPLFLVYIPQGLLYRTMIDDAGRSQTPAELADAAANSHPKLSRTQFLRANKFADKDGNLLVDKLLGSMTQPLFTLTTNSSGIVERRRIHPITLLDGHYGNRVRLGMTKVFPEGSDVPDYFKGA